MSNNRKKRVEMFNQDVGTHYIFNAHKPATGNYKRAMELMGTDLSVQYLSEISFLRMCGGAKEPGFIIFLCSL